LEVDIVVGYVETSGEDDEGVEDDDSESDFTGRDFDGLVAVHMFILSGCD
jgi:hypothetical protein